MLEKFKADKEIEFSPYRKRWKDHKTECLKASGQIFEWVKCKSEVAPTPDQALRNDDVWGCGGIAPHILKLGTRLR